MTETETSPRTIRLLTAILLVATFAVGEVLSQLAPHCPLSVVALTMAVAIPRFDCAVRARAWGICVSR